MNLPNKPIKSEIWTISDTPDFLELSKEQIVIIDLKISLGEAIRSKREAQGLSQAALAKQLATSQPRLVKVEQGEVSLDLMMRTLLASGKSTFIAAVSCGSPICVARTLAWGKAGIQEIPCYY